MIDFKANLQQASCNDVEVQTWTHNGVEVYSAFQPFYWINEGVVEAGYPSSYTNIQQSGTAAYLTKTGITEFGGYGYENWYIIGTTEAVSIGKAKYIDVVGTLFVGSENWFEVIGIKDGVETTIGRFTGDNTNIPIDAYDAVKLRTRAGNWASSGGQSHINTIYLH